MSTTDPRRRPPPSVPSTPPVPPPVQSIVQPIQVTLQPVEGEGVVPSDDVDAEGEDEEVDDDLPMDDATSPPAEDLNLEVVIPFASADSIPPVIVSSTVVAEEQDSESTALSPVATLPSPLAASADCEQLDGNVENHPPVVSGSPTHSTRDSAMDAAIAATLALLPPEDEEEEEEEEDVKPSIIDVIIPSPPSDGSPDTPMKDLSPARSPRSQRPTRFSDTPFIPPPVDLTLLDAGRQAALAFAARTKGTAKTRVAQLQARVEKDPLDGDARLALVKDAEEKGDLERTREVYNEFLKVFPDATQQWISFASLELSHSHFPAVEEIFSRCLRLSTAVEMWKFYLDYIRRVNPIDPNQLDRAKEARGVIAKAFEYALAHVGQDRKAGDMWMEYLAFLKEGQNRGTWEEQQRMDALRKAYQRAICIPVNNVEAIWQEYNQFENNLNKMTAKKFIAELSPSYMTARKALRELRAQFDQLPTPSLPRRPDWQSREDRDCLEMWKKYLSWEEANPLDLEDPQALAVRVGFAFKKAVATLRFFSEIWFVAASYHVKLGKVDEARSVLQAGIVANPTSLLLSYTLVDLEERRQDFPACHAVYDALIEEFHAQLVSLEEATQKELTTALEAFDKQLEVEGRADGDDAEGREKTSSEKEEITRTINEKRKMDVDVAKKGAANAWIAQMRFARRAEGIKQARAIFGKARKSKYLVWQVVEASAKIELHWNNDPKIATNVFELGLKLFSIDPEYVLQYLDFLIQTNNPNNARALFERTAALVEPAKSKPIWDRMAQFEYQYGDFLAAQKIFTRYSEAFPDSSAVDRFAQRYGYFGLDDALLQDLGVVASGEASDQTHARRSRSLSPRRAPGKRGLSVERGNYERPASMDRPSFNGPPHNGPPVDYGQKRMRPNLPIEVSPAPSSNGGWGRGVTRDEPMHDDHDFRRRRGFDGPSAPPLPPPNLNRPVPFALDPRGEQVAVLPEGVVFFLSILPGAGFFNGPKLDPGTILDVIGNTVLPGNAPAPGGERLGIPPRARSPRRGAGREPEYAYAGRERESRGESRGGGGGRTGRRH